MSSSLVILLALAFLVTLCIPFSEAAAMRRGNGGRKRGSEIGREKLVHILGRRGRTNYDSDAASANANGVDGDKEALYDGCDWKRHISDFLTICKWRKWCADEQGITDFGPYGEVPEDCPANEEGVHSLQSSSMKILAIF